MTSIITAIHIYGSAGWLLVRRRIEHGISTKIKTKGGRGVMERRRMGWGRVWDG